MESKENRLSAGRQSCQGTGHVHLSSHLCGALRPTWIGGAVVSLLLITTFWARAADAADPAFSNEEEGGRSTPGAVSGANDDNYNFNWLDPDKKIYVLQNRKFRKGNQLMLSVLGGLGLSNSYRNSTNLEFRGAYYFNETWGLEGFYTSTSNSSNNTYQALVGTNTTTLPVVRQVKSQMGGLLLWAPWYAKLNVFNSILYFDWYFSGGVGTAQTDLDVRTRAVDAPSLVAQNFTAFYFGTGHHYYLSQRFSIRLDVMGAYFSAPFKGVAGEKAWFPNYNLGIGVACRL